MDTIKSPIRYPGAKGRAIPQIAPLIPKDFVEYREPFLGGGSIYLYVRQKYPERKYWINDLNQRLYNFWKQTRQHSGSMVRQTLEWKKEYQNGKQLLQNLRINSHKFDDMQLACVYYINKKLSFSGFTRGFSESNFQKSFTEEKILQLKDLGNLLQNTQITNLDYQKVVEAPGDNVFILLDPPYFNVKWDELYGTGKCGSISDKNLHAFFDHHKFAEVMEKCKHRWLVTYDDSQTIRRLFSWANIIPFKLTYTSRTVKTGEELFISNYLEKIPEQKVGDECGWD